MRHSPWLSFFCGLVVILGIFIALPNLFTETQIAKIRQFIPFFPDTRVTLGLDLRGGSSLQLEIDSALMEREQLRNVLDTVRDSLRTEQIKTQSVRILNHQIIAEIPDPKQRSKALSLLRSQFQSISEPSIEAASPMVSIAEDETGLTIHLTKHGLKNNINKALDQSLEIIRQRIDKIGVAEPSIQKIGENRIQVQLPGLQDPAQLRMLLGTTAKMSFHLVANNVDLEHPPIGVSILPDYRENSPALYPIEDRVSLDGSMLQNALAAYEQGTNRPMISFELSSQGAREFAKISRDNIGRAFAIVLDGKVLTAPVIRSVIPNGRGEITGNFTAAEVATLSALLRAGALPAPLKVIEERSVGPDLGADSIRMGLYTGIIGFALVAVFMLLLYGSWGIIANIALALHTILTFSALSILGATLTLPGIAGIILGIGIAVDANILINERIREESRKNVSALASLDRGFKNAFRTIIDANVTIIIATIILWYVGTGPIRGFAITMLLGILISMFTNITMVRLIMNWVIHRWKIKNLTIKPLFSFFPQKTQFKFMNARFLGIFTSIILSAISIFIFFKPGLNYGVDFKGGIQLEITNEHPFNIALLRETLTQLHLGEVSLQTIGQNSQDHYATTIRLQRQDGGEEAQIKAVELVKQKLQTLYPDSKLSRTEVVGPKISGELARNGLLAVIFACIAVTFYIWWRFEWFFAAGAMITLILDMTKMVGIFVLFQFDFNLTAIAALMTSIGYSINDKIIVYDRMRENLRLYKKTSLRDIIDMSLNQVLIRCIFTALTTTLAMLPMAIWGGNAVHNFALPIVIGVVMATSSSLFIAAPILFFLGNWWENYRKKQTAAS